MEVETLRLGPYQTNCHILHNGKEAWIIDPGFNSGPVVHTIEKLELKVAAILLTHTHWDHTLGIPLIIESFGNIPLVVHASEASFLGSEGGMRLRSFAMALDPSQAEVPLSVWNALPQPTRLLTDGDFLDDCSLEVIHTPGHSPGSINYYHREAHLLFSGDTLFAGTIGRTDLPNSRPDLILDGIRKRLLSLPGDTIVYPGHGPTTTISREKGNPWLI